MMDVGEVNGVMEHEASETAYDYRRHVDETSCNE